MSSQRETEHHAPLLREYLVEFPELRVRVCEFRVRARDSSLAVPYQLFGISRLDFGFDI